MEQLNERECGKERMKRKHRLHGMQNKCMNASACLFSFSMLDIAFPFERDARKMTQHIISSLAIVAFFFSFLPFFSSRVGLDQVYPVRRYGLRYFYPRPPLSLPAPPLPLRVFSRTDGGIMKQAYSLYFLQRSPSVLGR